MNEIKKNDVFTVKIEDISEEGLGIGHIEGMAVFVKDTAPGDLADVKIVKLKKNYAFGRLEKIIEPAECRTEPDCPVARQCGGCTLQHISYETELEMKKKRVLSCMERIGGIEKPEEYLEGIFGMDSPYRYRNKMQFPVGYAKDPRDGAVLGFYAGRTHDIIPVGDCLIGHEVNCAITKDIKKWIDSNGVPVYDEKTGTGLVRHILTRVGFKTGELMVCIVSKEKTVPEIEKLVNALINDSALSEAGVKLTSVVVNRNNERTNRILGRKTFTVWGESYITDYIGDIQFRISAESFYQVNPVQTEKLYGKALEYAALTGTENVWDMYCGIGTISLFLAKNAAKVYGVEIVDRAIQDAKLNAEINEIKNAEFFVGKAEEVVPEWKKNGGKDIDVIVVDPPRKGCDEKLLETISEISPKRMVYVSCDPATLARDLKILLAKGFKLEKFSIYDQFARSMHVETVVQLLGK